MQAVGAFGVAVLVLVGALLLAVLAPAADARSPRITAPREGALVKGSALRVRVERTGPGFRALIGSRDITARFERRGGRVWVAKLRLGPDFKTGDRRLIVSSAGRYDAVHFLAARQRGSALRLRRLPRRSGRAPLHVRGRVAMDFDDVRLLLNGKRVPRRDWARSGRSFDVLLGADEGARFGRNELVVTVAHSAGVYDRLVRRFWISRRAPLAGAGADRRAREGRAVRLDGTSTDHRRGGRTAYRWRIVSSPRGSKAKLRGARSAKPRLRTDRRGRYVVELTARSRPMARKARGAKRFAGSGSRARSTDRTTVTAAPDYPPIGPAIETIVPGGGIEIDGKVYTSADASWVQVLTLDRATLEVGDNLGFAVSQSGELATTLANLAASGSDDLVILSGGGRSFSSGGQPTNGFTAATAQDLGKAIASIGGDLDPDGPLGGGLAALADGAWSLIGLPGLPVGTAHLSRAMVTSEEGEPGSLSGYLQLDQSSNYGFVSPDYETIDTNVPGAPAGINRMQVGSQVYETEAAVAPNMAGFHVVVLDGKLDLVTNRLFLTNLPTQSNPQGVADMAALLRDQASGSGGPGQNLVLVQSIGSPGGYDGDWLQDTNTVSNSPQSWGGSLAGAFGLLAGPGAHDQLAQMVAPSLTQSTPSLEGGYSLVASTKLSDPYGDAWSQSQAGSGLASSRVVGVIARNRDSQWQVQSPSAVSGFDTGKLPELAYRAPTAWPLNSGDYLAASRWIASQLGFSAPDVRAAYYQDEDGEWGSDLYRRLQQLTFDDGQGFTEAEFDQLRTQLETEFTMVSEVRAMVAAWQQTFGDPSFQDYVDLQGIAQRIESDINAEQGIDDSKPSFDVLAVMESTLDIAQGIAGFSGQEEVEVPLGVVAGAVEMADTVATQGPDGTPSTATIVTAADGLGEQLAARYEQLSSGMDQLGDLLVSDWGKLQQAAANANGVWETNRKTTGLIETGLGRAAQARFYAALLPLAYGQYVIDHRATSINSRPWEHPWNYRCQSSDGPNNFTEPFNPSEGNPASWVVSAMGFSDSLELEQQVRLISTGIDWASETNGEVGHEPQVLPRGISSMLFQSPAADAGLGQDQFRFFGDPAFKRWAINCNND